MFIFYPTVMSEKRTDKDTADWYYYQDKERNIKIQEKKHNNKHKKTHNKCAHQCILKEV